MFYVLSEDDANYLFGLLQKPLPSTLNPHRLQELMNTAILEQFATIQAERPEIIGKFQQMQVKPLEELLQPLQRVQIPGARHL